MDIWCITVGPPPTFNSIISISLAVCSSSSPIETLHRGEMKYSCHPWELFISHFKQRYSCYVRGHPTVCLCLEDSHKTNNLNHKAQLQLLVLSPSSYHWNSIRRFKFLNPILQCLETIGFYIGWCWFWESLRDSPTTFR